MTKNRLSQDDWLAAGFRALSSQGPTALRAEALARDLKTTKGSFYWHFADLAAFKAAMLELWREKVAGEIIAEVMVVSDPYDRLRVLAASAAKAAPEAFGGRNIEPAIRAWALTDESVRLALDEVDTLRLTFVQNLLRDIGEPDAVTAELVYGAYIGLDDLASKRNANIGKGLDLLVDLIITQK